MLNNNPETQTDNTYRYFAGFGRRVLAGVIDLFIIILISAVAVLYLGLTDGWRMILQMIHHEPLKYAGASMLAYGIPVPVATLVLVTIILIPWLYCAFLESSRNQATLGKMVARIIVTDLHGNRVTFTRASLRHFSKYLSFLFFFTGVVAIVYTSYSQGFHDMIAACLVYYRPEKME